jgi:hypothetical protein
MNMQQALQSALDVQTFARPAADPRYSYRYEEHGKSKLIHIHGRDRFGVFRSDFWRTLSQVEIEADWLLCDRDGNPVDPNKPFGMTLMDMAA